MTFPLVTFRAEDRLIHSLDLIVSITGQNYQYHLARALERYVKQELVPLQKVVDDIAIASSDIQHETAAQGGDTPTGS